jgi:electron transport complex protein RnfC
MRLHRFHGGLRLDGHKAASTGSSIRACPLPSELVLPLLQHAGEAAQPCVGPGDRVRRGQRIADAQGERGADLHAPCAGHVHAIENRTLPFGADVDGPCVVLVPDPQDAGAALLPPLDWREASPASLRERIRDAGIVGLGGAAFPTAEKLEHARELLILNGAECEPWIACDDALLRERAAEVVQGGRVLRRAVGATRVLLAIEDRMPEALAAAAQAIAMHGAGEIELAAVPTVYPVGGERQLIRVLTGIEVPSAGLPRDVGVIVQNVGTAAAAWRAVDAGEALVSRIVTVTGPGVVAPGNFEVAFGTPVSHLVAQAGGYTRDAARLLVGGPMMGIALPHDAVPIVKGSNCVLVLDAAQLRDPAPELPCIRCGDCASACPARLQPQQLLWHLRAGRLDRAVDAGLYDCIECGCCDLACPSHIPLVAQYRNAKSEHRARSHEATAAEAARLRFEARTARLAREAAEREAQPAERARNAASVDAVQAALARARARKSGAAEPGE